MHILRFFSPATWSPQCTNLLTIQGGKANTKKKPPKKLQISLLFTFRTECFKLVYTVIVLVFFFFFSSWLRKGEVTYLCGRFLKKAWTTWGK